MEDRLKSFFSDTKNVRDLVLNGLIVFYTALAMQATFHTVTEWFNAFHLFTLVLDLAVITALVRLKRLGDHYIRVVGTNAPFNCYFVLTYTTIKERLSSNERHQRKWYKPLPMLRRAWKIERAMLEISEEDPFLITKSRKEMVLCKNRREGVIILNSMYSLESLIASIHSELGISLEDISRAYNLSLNAN